MAATFDPTLPVALDRLRYRLGDTDTAAAFMPDETYAAILDLYDNDEGEAFTSLKAALKAKFAHLVDYKAGTESEEASQRFKNLQALDETGTGGTGGGFMVVTPVRLSECEAEFG